MTARTELKCPTCGQKVDHHNSVSAPFCGNDGDWIDTWDLLILDIPNTHPVHLVVNGMCKVNGDGTLDTGGRSFYYGSHTCPTNFMRVLAIVDGDDTDPHGIWRWRASIPEPTEESLKAALIYTGMNGGVSSFGLGVGDIGYEGLEELFPILRCNPAYDNLEEGEGPGEWDAVNGETVWVPDEVALKADWKFTPIDHAVNYKLLLDAVQHIDHPGLCGQLTEMLEKFMEQCE